MLRETRNAVGVKSTPERVGPWAISSGVDHRDAQPAAVLNRSNATPVRVIE